LKRTLLTLEGYANEEDLMEIFRKKKEHEIKNPPLMIGEKGPIY